jgi:hypothetical protein
MPIQINERVDGEILGVHVSGILARADYERFVPEFEQLVQRHGKLRVFFDMTGFQGWEAAAIWQEIIFEATHPANLERLALVGDKPWQHIMAILCKPFTRVTCRYFDHTDAAKARQWLADE